MQSFTSTIICEKPSVAREIATTLNCSKKTDGFLFNDQYAITWAFGHLVQLAAPDAYGYSQKWTIEQLPILPQNFLLEIKKVKTDKGLVDDPGAKKQLDIIQQLFSNSKNIIVATDAGREGELIFRNIYHFLACKKPFSRLWISSLTEKSILEGFRTLKSGAEYDNLYYAAKCRAEADWLVGINATQSLTLATGNKMLISLGRVQTPTLSLICRRYLDNTSFKPIPFWLLKIKMQKSTSFEALAVDPQKDDSPRFHNPTLPNELAAKLKNSSATVQNIESSISKEQPPLLFDLSALQQYCNKHLNLSADQTLKIAQELYEKKLITYPRTGSQYISEDIFETIPEIIEKVASFSPFVSQAHKLLQQTLNTRSVNGNKVTDHHAIIPTGIKPSNNLSESEISVLNIIIARFLEAFYDPCIKQITTATFHSTAAPEYLFVSKGSVIKQPGWRSVLNVTEEEEDIQSLPDLSKGENIPILDAYTKAEKTKPLPLYTEGTLLKAMETCGKEIEDEQLRAAMRDAGLGTPATRAAIIETLFQRQYIERQKKSLIPTQKGLAVYDLVKDKSIAQPILTGEWEYKLEQINQASLDHHQFMQDITLQTQTLTADLLTNGTQIHTDSFKPGSTNVVCPVCKKGNVILRDKAAGCSEYAKGCNFTVWRTVASKKLTDNQIIELIKKGKSPLIKGLVSKSEKTFEAYLILQPGGGVGFEFKK